MRENIKGFICEDLRVLIREDLREDLSGKSLIDSLAIHGIGFAGFHQIYYMKMFIKSTAVVVFLLSGFTGFAQTTKDSVSKWLTEKQFIFVANSADPLRGSTRFLTGSYDMKVNKDSLVSYLPYFGRSQVAPMNPDETGLRFTSTNFDYSFSPGKKNRWNVAIIIKDQSNVTKYLLTVYSDGNADLIATSNFRDQISFRGYVRGIKAK